MPDDKRNRGDQQQGGNQGSPDRQRKDRKPGSGSMEPPESGRTPREEDEEQRE